MMRQLLPTAFMSVLTILLAGCLDFGEDALTTAPTQAQVDRCRAEMFLNPALKITPMGFKLLGTGMDDVIWFKFKTGPGTAGVQGLFDAKAVDTAKFMEGYAFSDATNAPKWWDVKGKTFLGGQVDLPRVKFMHVGIEKQDNHLVVYIMWHEV